jgi:hypothetical protein
MVKKTASVASDYERDLDDSNKLTLNNNIDCLPLVTQAENKHPDTAERQHHHPLSWPQHPRLVWIDP